MFRQNPPPTVGSSLVDSKGRDYLSASEVESDLSAVGFLLAGLAAGLLLGSTGVIGPFLVPALLLLGLPSTSARGTTLVSELFMTFTSLLAYRKAGNLDKRLILAYLPGAAMVALGANLSVNIPELAMKLLIGVFEIFIGAMIVWSSIRIRVTNRETLNLVISRSMLGKLVIIAILAGFTKGFLGAGWGPIGIGLFVLVGIDPRIAIGSSLAIRLMLDVVGGATYAYMNLVDVNAVVILTLAGCLGSLVAARFAARVQQRTLRVFLGPTIMLLGALVILQV
jgi:uncharacterized membrane protein YfcA